MVGVNIGNAYETQLRHAHGKRRACLSEISGTHVGTQVGNTERAIPGTQAEIAFGHATQGTRDPGTQRCENARSEKFWARNAVETRDPGTQRPTSDVK